MIRPKDLAFTLGLLFVIMVYLAITLEPIDPIPPCEPTPPRTLEVTP